MSLELDKSHWKRVAFGDVVRNVNESVRDAAAAGIDRVIAMEHMDPGELRIHRWSSIEDGTSFARRVRPGQTLFGKRRAYQRKVAFAEFDAICSGDILTFEADEAQMLPEFLPFLVESNAFFNHALGTSVGSLSPRTNWRDLANFEFGLPPFDEQKRIANLLWAVERHWGSTASEPLRKVEALLLDGLLEESAPMVAISDMGSVLMGRQRSPQHADGDHMVPYLRVANVGDNQLRLDDIKTMNFTPAEQQRYSVVRGDILVSEGQSRELVGQSALIGDLPERMCFQNTLIRFRPGPDKVCPQYAQALFRACLRNGTFADIAVQTTSIAHLGVQRFAALKLPLPTLNRQETLLRRMDLVQSGLQAAAAELTALTTLRSSILADIFGGD